MAATKFLIIRFSSIGDIVLTTPVVRCLKQQYPEAEIHYVVKKKFGMVLEHNPYIDQLHYLDGNLKELIRIFRKENFDYVIDLHKTLRSYWLRAWLRRKTLSFRKLSVEKFLLNRFHLDLLPRGVHIVERNLEAVRPLGVVNDGKPVDYFIAPDEEVHPERVLPFPYQNGFVVFVIGGQHYTKRLPLEKIMEVCKRLRCPVLLLGGPEDREVARQVTNRVAGPIYDLCGKLRFNESVSLVRQARVVITHDTGLMHISGAFDKRVISVWGATSPDRFGVWPYLNSEREEFLVEGLNCHPCSNFGSGKCPKGHFKCMRLQDTAAIAAAGVRWFNNT